jgi:hypothetical protein
LCRYDLGVLGWIKLAWKYVRRPFVDPTNLPGDNKSIMVGGFCTS